MPSRKDDTPYPPISDYALISDCHSVALVSTAGAIDWCCMPRIDADSCFGRLLDWKRGGHWALHPSGDGFVQSRRYLPETMVLETVFESRQGKVLVYDFFGMDAGTQEQARFDCTRVVKCDRGHVDLHTEIVPRFDFGEIVPYLRKHEEGYSAIGSNKGLVICADTPLEVRKQHGLVGDFSVAAGQCLRFVMHFAPPETIGDALVKQVGGGIDADAGLTRTIAWWQQWSGGLHVGAALDEQSQRSALVLKALTYEPTGAIAAAATTSLPEAAGRERNWDYRFSWVRDSVLSVRALYLLGRHREAERFLDFIQRSAAGSASQLQIMYGVDGKRRLTEVQLPWLEGYRQSRPVRIGNLAASQTQLDIYGEIMEVAWEWHASRHTIDEPYWQFLTEVVDAACASWNRPDHGFWEIRSTPRHHVHSKAMCWSAVDYGMRLAEACQRPDPVQRWRHARDQMREAIERDGYDSRRGIFVQAFGGPQLDAVLLLLPRIGFVAYEDPRMVRTADAIAQELDRGGLLARYETADGLPSGEGAFLSCTFWLAACLAYQGREDDAWRCYRRALACVNDVGLFSEEFDCETGDRLGNFPQGLTHVSQIMARLALARCVPRKPTGGGERGRATA